MNTKLKNMVMGALLIALAIIIPIQFGFLKVIIGPFSATLVAHVPLFIAMLISPKIAAAVGGGSTIGFLMAGMPMPVVARAATHIIVGYVGALIVQKKKSFTMALAITAPLHGILEALVCIPFGFTAYEILVVLLVGAILHHSVDSVISVVLAKSIAKVNNKEMYAFFSGNKEEDSNDLNKTVEI